MPLAADDEKRRPPTQSKTLDKKGKGREVLSWAEGFDRALDTMGGRDASMKVVQCVPNSSSFKQSGDKTAEQFIILLSGT